jgi:hypothetical protein
LFEAAFRFPGDEVGIVGGGTGFAFVALAAGVGPNRVVEFRLQPADGVGELARSCLRALQFRAGLLIRGSSTFRGRLGLDDVTLEPLEKRSLALFRGRLGGRGRGGAAGGCGHSMWHRGFGLATGRRPEPDVLEGARQPPGRELVGQCTVGERGPQRLLQTTRCRVGHLIPGGGRNTSGLAHERGDDLVLLLR